MLKCPSPTAIKGRKKALANLEESLDDMGTHPDITSLIVLSIDTSGQPVCDKPESDIDLQNILNAQTDIGWDLLQFGFAAMAWKNAQHKWEKHRDPNYNSKRSEQWSRQLQESLWEYVSAVWDHRNKLVHCKDHQENMSKRLYLL